MQVRYVAPARLDDVVTVTVKVLECGKASMQLEQNAWRGVVLLSAATVRVGCVDAATLRPRRMPQEVLHALT
jgi:acyl-CoA thioester hydrolase